MCVCTYVQPERSITIFLLSLASLNIQHISWSCVIFFSVVNCMMCYATGVYNVALRQKKETLFFFLLREKKWKHGSVRRRRKIQEEIDVGIGESICVHMWMWRVSTLLCPSIPENLLCSQHSRSGLKIVSVFLYVYTYFFSKHKKSFPFFMNIL